MPAYNPRSQVSTFPLPLTFDRASRLKNKLASEQLINGARHLNRVGNARSSIRLARFTRVTPQVLNVLALADDPGHDRAAVDPDPELQGRLVLQRVLTADMDYANGHALGVIGYRLG